MTKHIIAELQPGRRRIQAARDVTAKAAASSVALAALAGHRPLSSILPYIDASDDQKRAAVELIS